MPSRLEESADLKKQLISVLFMGILIIGAWWAYSALTAKIFRSNQYDRQDQLANTNNMNVIKEPIEFPNFTIPKDWNSFNDIPQWLIDAMMNNPNMTGDLGGFENMDQLNTVVFRVYANDSHSLGNDELWRISAYDQYTGSGWERSDSSSGPLSETSPGFSHERAYTIRMPVGGSTTSVGLPTTFPYPRVVLNSLYGDYIDSYNLFIDSQNGSTLNFHSVSNDDQNITYTIYKEHAGDDAFFQSSALEPQYTPTSIKAQYLGIPGGLTNYRNTHPNFNTHLLRLQNYVAGNGSTTTYDIADVIRNYLADNFKVDTTFPFERPPNGEDIVEWFLGRGEGLPMDFAATFVIFCRAFNISSRYVFGYNSFYSSPMPDPGYNNEECLEIKFMNMYAWNEVYMPLDLGTGAGEFHPMIISNSVSYPVPGNSSEETDTSLNILINGTYVYQMAAGRGSELNISMELFIPSDEGSNASQSITLYDETMKETIGTVVTDSNGYANFTYYLSNDKVAGAHLISFTESPLIRNISVIILEDTVNVQLVSVNPTNISRDVSNTTHVNAYIYDPLNGKRVRSAVLSPTLVKNDDAILHSIDPSDIKVDVNGSIDQDVTVVPGVDQGLYYFRVDFNGSYSLDNPYDPSHPFAIYYPGAMNTSSSKVLFNITDPNQKVFDLYFNMTYTQGQEMFIKRSGSINISVYLQQGNTPVAGGHVNILDNTYGNTFITQIITGSNGWGSYIYDLNDDFDHWIAGVHELYGEWTEGNRYNQSIYLIVNESVSVMVNNFGPNEINRSGTENTQFNMAGYVWDYGVNGGSGAASRYSIITLSLNQEGADKTVFLDPDASDINCGSSGYFNVNYGVDDNTPLGNYNVTAEFIGRWALPNGHQTIVSSLSNSSANYSLTVNDPGQISLELWVNGSRAVSSYYGSSAMSVNRNGYVNLTIRLKQGLTYQSGKTVSFYDDTSGALLGTRTTNGQGYATLIFQMDNTFTAGLNRLKVTYSSVSNYTQVYLADNMNITVSTIPISTALRTSDVITISGYIRDLINNHVVKEAQVKLIVKDNNGVDVTSQISDWVSGTSGDTQYSSAVDGKWSFSFKMPISFQGPYYILVSFTGNTQDSNALCPADYSDPTQIQNSSQYLTKVYAGVSLTAYYRPDVFTILDNVEVWGRLTYDNGTLFSTAQTLNVTFVDSNGQLCRSDSYNDTVDFTVATGDYYSTTKLLWSNTDRIYVEYYRDDANYVWGIKVQAVYSE
ncbi:MAG: DUF3488 and transglutaminase-like domain-containing protein [Promethearchaeota archaeon]